MPTSLTRSSMILLAVLAMAYALPAGFNQVFGNEPGSPLLFFSPLQKQFVYQESLGGHLFNYKNEEGATYDRVAFEDQLPFLYYKNLEKRNKLPFMIAGQSYDEGAIKAARQGLEIKARNLNRHFPQIQLYPLFNNDPQAAMMPFPEDVFRFTGQAMEFINADFNRIDEELTARFTSALRAQGFVFPATVIGGAPTNLKPFDEGYFIRDSSGHVFHVKRINNQPSIIKTGIDPSLAIADIIVSENARREFYGTIITGQGEIRLISTDDYRLIPLPLQGFDPKAMDFKLLIDPLYKTAAISGDTAVHGTAMTPDYQPLRRYSLTRRDNTPVAVSLARDVLFPWRLELDNPYRGQAALRMHPGGLYSLIGIASALALFYLLSRGRHHTPVRKEEWMVVLFTGLPGLLAVSMLREKQ